MTQPPGSPLPPGEPDQPALSEPATPAPAPLASSPPESTALEPTTPESPAPDPEPTAPEPPAPGLEVEPATVTQPATTVTQPATTVTQPGAPPSAYPGQQFPSQYPGQQFPSQYPQQFPPQGPPPGYPAQAFPSQPGPPPGYAASGAVPHPASAPPDQYPYVQFGPPAAALGGKKRGLLVALLVAAGLLALCGGAGGAAWLVTSRSSGGKGQVGPAEAVDGFLTAVYQDKDPTKAATYVCRGSRDTAKITKKLNEIKQQDQAYDEPAYSWTTPATEQTRTNEAIMTSTLTLLTADEQRATQKLRFVVTRNNGWWVCDVSQES